MLKKQMSFYSYTLKTDWNKVSHCSSVLGTWRKWSCKVIKPLITLLQGECFYPLSEQDVTINKFPAAMDPYL